MKRTDSSQPELNKIAAFEKLYDRYGGALYKMLLDRTGNDPELATSALKDIFIKAYARFDEYRIPELSTFSWLYRIMNEELKPLPADFNQWDIIYD
jgi:DNA-directed RNA polymerase specialized sigma24 family protein